ncbi:MAG TPA: F0F1 ATP synthase subunit A [Bacteroidia bacterium]|nr:F0F1 ATP synthase subunit A [Bacteroidia bacterium]
MINRIFFGLSLLISLSVFAQESEHHSESNSEEKVDISKIAFEHILDSHYWHFWGEGHNAVSIPLPCIVYSDKRGLMFFSASVFEHGTKSYNGLKLEEDVIVSENPDEKIYDLSITKNVVQLFIVAGLLILILSSVAKAYRSTGVNSAPKGLQSLLEPVIIFIRDEVARQNIPLSKADNYVPFLLTLFFLILFNNLLGLIPISANVTGNIAFTLTLAIIVLITVHLKANKYYWKHIFMPPAPVALWPILIPIEIIGIFTKPFALMIRLFANITAGHIIIISLVGLIFMFKSLYIAPLSVAFGLFIDILETFVAFLQAYIFTLLASLYIGGAIEEHHH